tara:strand:- start:69 stop:233 length:165 start_codon:yes stop_codon:yes gene_type:complete
MIGLEASKTEVNYLVVQIEHNLGAKCSSPLRFGAIVVRQLTNWPVVVGDFSLSG